MKKIHFVLRHGVYPFYVGGMEIFNYYLIQNLLLHYEVSYSAYESLQFAGCKRHKLKKLRPSSIFEPFQLFFFLLAHRDIKTVVYSFSQDRWFAWALYALFQKILQINYIAVIHFGKNPSCNHKRSIRFFFKNAKKVIAVSKDIKNKYEALYKIRCDVCYPLVPFTKSDRNKEYLRAEYGIPQKANVICMVGSIKQMKNPDTVIKAISLMSESELSAYNPYVVFAGSGPMLETLKQMAQELGIAQRVKFLGFIPKETVNEIFELSDIYVICSDFEGTSVSLLEAMSHKIPIIATNVQGINDTVQKDVDCLMFDLNDTKTLKTHICTLLSNEHLKSKLTSNAYQHYSEKYNYSNIIDYYKNVL